LTSAGVLASVLCASALLPAAARAQAAGTPSPSPSPSPSTSPSPSPPSVESIQQLRQELEALKADEARAQAAAAERARRIEALERQLASPPGASSPLPANIAYPTTTAAPSPTATAVAAQPNAQNPPIKVRVFGSAILDTMYSQSRPQAPGFPVFLVPRFAGGFPSPTLDINARQSQVGLAFTGPTIGKFRTGGVLSMVFFDNDLFSDLNGFLAQQSYGELVNDQWRFAAGLQLDLFAPGSPTILPFSRLGGQGMAGNNIKGQIRAEHYANLSPESQMIFQLAFSEPLNTAKTPDIVLDEDNGIPNVEGRIAFAGGKPVPIGIGLITQRPVEIGISGVIGQLRRTAPPDQPPRRVVSNVWGLNVDYRISLSRAFGFKGEAYTGQALGNYSGDILQSLDAITWKAIRGKGGWIEVFAYWKPNLHSHGGIGIDTANPDDITTVPNSLFGRTWNQTLWANLLWDVNPTFRIGIEGTHRSTRYKDATLTGRLPNSAYGLATQFMWTFGDR
jgi:hypothetical protein